MTEVVFAVPGDIAAATGGYAYARRLLAHLPAQGMALRHLMLPASFPHPGESDLLDTVRLLRATPERAVLLIDGLAYGAIPVRKIESLDRRIVALVHHPLCLETGLDPGRQAALRATETAALARAEAVIATSGTVSRLLAADFGVPSSHITVAEPGTEVQARTRGTGSPVRLLAVGTVSPRKGYDVLIAALGGLAGLDWHVTVAGALDRAPAAVASLRNSIKERGLGGQVTLAGAVGEAALAELYDRADVFVSASLFEGYGMALAEAMARGLPLVASTGGAAGETVPDGAGLKVPPGDVAALQEALRSMILDPARRRAFADRSWGAGQRLPRWSDTAARVADAIRGISP